MYVDASAFLAVLFQEPEADLLADRLEAAAWRCTSPITIFEAVAGLMSRNACRAQMPRHGWRR
ncbi:MAG TPA: type II toxin-antitoxin system VapC family toxin [Xanthobacteraceae bacterium]|nr:type II toxin-antitoxin system VapC family toxin [Xanthobacteraceae bacterium]